MTTWAYQNIFPEELIQLNKEVSNHPELMTLLANHPSGEWEIKMAEIALYCEVIVDGTYLPEEMQKLAGILTKKLIERRKDNRGLVVIENTAEVKQIDWFDSFRIK